MKTYLIIATLATIALAEGQPRGANADLDPAPTEVSEQRDGRRDRGATPPLPESKLEKLLESMDLSEEKQTEVRKILETHRKATARRARRHEQQVRRFRERIHQAGRAVTSKAAAVTRRRMQKLTRHNDRLRRRVMKQLREHLNDRQIAKFRGLLRPPETERPKPEDRLMKSLGRVSLTREQKARVRKIIADARAEAMRNALRKIETEVLNPEQREELESQDVFKLPQERRERGEPRRRRARRARDPRGPRKTEGAHRGLMRRGRPRRGDLAGPQGRVSPESPRGHRGPIEGPHRGLMGRVGPGRHLMGEALIPREGAIRARGPHRRCPCCGGICRMSPGKAPLDYR